MAASCNAQRSTGQALAGQVPAGALAVRLRDGDIQPTEADRLAGACEAAHVAELGPDRYRGQPADPIVPLERLAAWLGPRDTSQLGVGPQGRLRLQEGVAGFLSGPKAALGDLA